MGTLQFNHLASSSVAAADQLSDPVPVRFKAVEVAAAAQDQRLLNGTLEMAMMALDCAVLVRQARIVAADHHAVVVAERIIAPGLVNAGIVVEIAKCRRQTVRSVLRWCPG